jgi:hypothetical protein
MDLRGLRVQISIGGFHHVCFLVFLWLVCVCFCRLLDRGGLIGEGSLLLGLSRLWMEGLGVRSRIGHEGRIGVFWVDFLG